MKKLIFIVLTIFSVASVGFAQDAKKALKNAAKDLTKYYQDPVNNAPLLDAALKSINSAFEDPLVAADPESYLTKGNIYKEVANSEFAFSGLNPNYKLKTLDAGIQAYSAFMKLKELAVKKNHAKDALTGLSDIEGVLSRSGAAYFDKQDYLSAFKNFNTMMAVSKLLKENKMKSSLDAAEDFSNIQHYTALTGYYGKADEAELMPILEDMFKAGTDKAVVYEALYNFKKGKDEAGALAVLEAGRKKLPEETSILFAEINHYLGKGNLDVLIDKLKSAIAKEPKNVSLYTTLGNVYDQLSVKEKDNTAKHSEYFKAAMDYYTQAIAIDDKNATAVYSIGALYYNRAASFTPEINKLANDYSAAATKKYDALKAEMLGEFEKALPYFIKSEQIDPKDKNTLIALKEIYARKSLFDKVNEYKGKLEALDAK
jgi:tetratricopeptide (TPR) repeat protein